MAATKIRNRSYHYDGEDHRYSDGRCRCGGDWVCFEDEGYSHGCEVAGPPPAGMMLDHYGKRTDRLVEHPEVRVKLVGEDGNAFAVLGRVRAAMKHAGVTKSEIDRYTELATSGDYDQLLRVTMDWVEVE